MTSRWLRQLRIVGVAFSLTWTASEATFVACAQDRGVAADAKPSRTEDDAEQVRKGRLDEMRRLAEGTVVSRLDGAEKVLARLVAEPVFRFDSQYYGAIDATLWLYGDEGRPAAAQTVVCWRRPGFPKHEYCLVSLSEGLIEAQWAGDRQWLSTSPGITVRPLPDGPKPAPTEAAHAADEGDDSAFRGDADGQNAWARYSRGGPSPSAADPPLPRSGVRDSGRGDLRRGRGGNGARLLPAH